MRDAGCFMDDANAVTWEDGNSLFFNGEALLHSTGSWLLSDMLLDWASQDPAPSAAVLQGLFFGRVAPPRSERGKMETRALVIGHPRDPIHPFSDAGMLVRELRNGRMLEASSLVELRLAPARLTKEIAAFVDECWKPAAAPDRRVA